MKLLTNALDNLKCWLLNNQIKRWYIIVRAVQQIQMEVYGFWTWKHTDEENDLIHEFWTQSL